MHELAVTQGILDVALNAARQEQARQIVAIDLVIGDLSTIVDESVQFYFDILSRETPAAGARLRFRREPAAATCRTCGHAFAASLPLALACPACASTQIEVSGGRAFYVESIEVSDEVSDEDTRGPRDTERQ